MGRKRRNENQLDLLGHVPTEKPKGSGHDPAPRPAKAAKKSTKKAAKKVAAKKAPKKGKR